MSNELREAAQRVTGYVRAWQLLSNTDNELIGEVHVMPAGAGEPMELALFASDLEALAGHAIGATPTEAEAEPENKYGACPILGCGYAIGPDDLPPRPVHDFGEAANEVIAMLAETAEELAVAGTIGHHVLDHSMADLMDTITHLGSQMRFQAVALPEDANAEIVARAELESLRAGARLLDALYAAGVDNWEGYAEVKVNR